MGLNLTREDSRGTLHLRSWALPLVIAMICIPIVALLALSVVSIEGTGLGLAAGALAVASILIGAARLKPSGPVEVAPSADSKHRVLVLATHELGPDEAGEIARAADGADDVRLLVPREGSALDRWASATDRAQSDAQDRLAISAGALVAAGLPVSGSVGDGDPAQALEDELRAFAADELVLAVGTAEDPALADAEARLSLPVKRIGRPAPLT
jgi:hypothetical protein